MSEEIVPAGRGAQPEFVDETIKGVEDVRELDAAAVFIAQHGGAEISAEESARVRRKINMRLLPLMALMYIMQQLDKSAVSLAAVFNLQKDAHLVGQQYAWLTTITYIAALVGQPASAYALSRFPVNRWVCWNFIAWSVCMLLMAACTNFAGLMALRFFLGLFEASIAPTMMIVVSMWWTRREQNLVSQWWYLQNGTAGILGSLLTWGVGHATSTAMKPYQLIFLVIGLISFAASIPTFFLFPESPIKARFLSDDEKRIAVERVRFNQTGIQGSKFKWYQVREAFLDIKTLLIVGVILPHAITAGGLSAFGPLVLESFGLDQFQTILYNMIPSAMQIVLGLVTAWVMMVTKQKAPTLIVVQLVTLAGAVGLWICPRGDAYTSELMGFYYMLQFSGNVAPLAFGWANANTAGGTKKATLVAIEWASVCIGNAIGPQLFTANSAPYYFQGLQDNLISLSVMTACAVALVVYLHFCNVHNKSRRHSRGMTEDLVDYSLENENKWAGMRRVQEEKDLAEGVIREHGEQAFLDLTDKENDEFIYSF